MRGGHDYARTINPTRTALEDCLASLEEADHGVAFSSGMSAISAIMELVPAGARTVAINDVYGGTYRLFSKILEPQGLSLRVRRPRDRRDRAEGARPARRRRVDRDARRTPC